MPCWHNWAWECWLCLNCSMLLSTSPKSKLFVPYLGRKGKGQSSNTMERQMLSSWGGISSSYIFTIIIIIIIIIIMHIITHHHAASHLCIIMRSHHAIISHWAMWCVIQSLHAVLALSWVWCCDDAHLECIWEVVQQRPEAQLRFHAASSSPPIDVDTDLISLVQQQS